MCCSMANIYPALRQRFGQWEAGDADPIYYVNAFQQPLFPVITEEEPDKVQYFQWGLIPSYCQTIQRARSLAQKTVNARSETVWNKPSFAQSIRNHRCLVPVTGFFEWYDQDGKKYPYFIRVKGKKDFALAGIWSPWFDPETKRTISTFSILTTSANSFVAAIHNLKKRMPVVLTSDEETLWLNKNATTADLKALLKPYEGEMEAWPVRKINPRSQTLNVPETLERFDYPELDS